MCTQLRRIKSNQMRYRPLVARAFYDVPCGKCDDCRNAAKDEWFVRLQEEINTYSRAEGKCCFLTLTYNEKCLPRFKYVDENTGECFSIPCFDKHDKDRFINSIIQYFKRRGCTSKTTKSGLGLKFMVNSEYGEDPDHTHRSHYHAVLLFPPEYIEKSGFSCVTHWMDFFQNLWHLGFVRKSKEYGLWIDPRSDFAARYVSKYCTKEIDWFEQPDVQSFLYDHGVNQQDRYEAIKDFLPRHWQSKGFGIGLVEYCKDDIVFKDGIDFNFLSDRNLGKKKLYQVPRYIKRKLLYDYDPITRLFTLNERGKSYNRHYVDDIIADSVDKLSKYISVDYINSKKIPDEFYNLYFDRFGVRPLGEHSLVSDFKSHLVSGCTLTDVSWYKKFIKGHICHLEDSKYFANLSLYRDPRHGHLEEICKYIQDLSFYDDSPQDRFYSEGYMYHRDFSSEMLFFLDDLPVFRNFDLFLQKIEFLRDFLSKRSNKIYREDLRRRKLLKRLIS